MKRRVVDDIHITIRSVHNGFMRVKEVNNKEDKDYAAMRLLVRRIIVGSVVILFIGVCSLAMLIVAMLLL